VPVIEHLEKVDKVHGDLLDEVFTELVHVGREAGIRKCLEGFSLQG